MMLCSICKKRPAVIFISLAEGESPFKGLCLRCAQKMSSESFYEFINNILKTIQKLYFIPTQYRTFINALFFLLLNYLLFTAAMITVCILFASLLFLAL